MTCSVSYADDAVDASASQTFTQNSAPKYSKALLQNGSDPVAGNVHGKITLVDFFDYQCPHCLRVNNSIDKLIKEHPDLRIVFKMFPVLGPASDLAAHAAIAANNQGKFQVFHNALINTDDITLDKILELAKNNGLDVEKFKQDMNSTTVSSIVANDLDLANRLGITGAPAIFITPTHLSETANPQDVIFILGEADFNTLQDSVKKIDH
jgi:protein-disulfide isomerase